MAMPRAGSDTSSAGASATGSGPSPASAQAAAPAAAISAPPVKRPRRTHARRSCLSCRQRKARCELPEHSLAVPSSMAPLEERDKCHRCGVLRLDCIVWDGSRKRGEDGRMRYGAQPVEHARSSGSPTTSTRAKSRGGDRSNGNNDGENDDEDGVDGDDDDDDDDDDEAPAAWSGYLDGNWYGHAAASLSSSSPPPRLGPKSNLLAPIIDSCSAIPRKDGRGRVQSGPARPQEAESRNTRPGAPHAGFPGTESNRSSNGPSSGRAGGEASSSSTPSGSRGSNSLPDQSTAPSSAGPGGARPSSGLRPTILSAPEPSSRPSSSFFSVSPISQLAEFLWRQEGYQSRIAIGKGRPIGRQRADCRLAREPASMGDPAGEKESLGADRPRSLGTDTVGFETFVLRLSLWCPFLDVAAATGRVEPTDAVTFLRHVVSYLFLRDGASRPAALATFPAIASEASQHLICASCDRHAAQAMLLLALYEPIELTLPPPEPGLVRRCGRLPGSALISAVQRTANSLKLLDSLNQLHARGGLETGRVPVQGREQDWDEQMEVEALKEACRDAALWLSSLLLEINGVSLLKGNHSTALALPPFLSEEEEALRLLALARNKMPSSDTHLQASLSLLLTRAKLYRRVHRYLSMARLLGYGESSSLVEADRMSAAFADEVGALMEQGCCELARLSPSSDLIVLTRYLQIEALVCQVRPNVTVTIRCLLGDVDIETIDVAQMPSVIRSIGPSVLLHLANMSRATGQAAQKALCILGFVRSQKDIEVLRCAPTVPLCSLAMTLSKGLAERMAASMYGFKIVPPGCEPIISGLTVARDALMAVGRAQPDNLITLTAMMVGGIAASVDASTKELTRKLAQRKSRGDKPLDEDPIHSAMLDRLNRIVAGEVDTKGRKLTERPPSPMGEQRQAKRSRVTREHSGTTTSSDGYDTTASGEPNQLPAFNEGSMLQVSRDGAAAAYPDGPAAPHQHPHAMPRFISDGRLVPVVPGQSPGGPGPGPGPGPGHAVYPSHPAQAHQRFPPLHHHMGPPPSMAPCQASTMPGSSSSGRYDEQQALAEWNDLGIDLELWSNMLHALNPGQAQNGPP